MGRIGIDVGGSFTDAVMLDDAGGVRIAKVPSTPSRIEAGFLDALQDLLAAAGARTADVAYLAHGTTVATNAVVTRSFARTALVTNDGFADVLAIGTQMRRNVYDLWTPEPEPLVPRERCHGVPGRIDAQGVEVEPLNEEAVRCAAARMRSDGTEAVAVMGLFSFLNAAHERRIGEILAEELPGLPVTLSSDVVPEFREYPRAATAAANAALMPLVGAYVGAVERELAEAGVSAPLHLMQSNGGVAPAERARDRPIALAASGPAAGVIGGARLARDAGETNAITFDMGGTTADIGIAPGGEPQIRFDGDAAGTPISIPQIDVLCIGAGGGSIASVDDFGALSVGPASAGADPGPAAYGRGGQRATVTDAHVVLGTLGADRRLAGRLPLDRGLAEAAIRRDVAEPLGLGVEDAAVAVLRILNANMANAVRVMSVARGLDPRDFALVAIGGAGPMHGCQLADEVGIPRVVVPRFPGVAAAWGLLATDIRHDLRRTWRRPTAQVDPADLDAEMARLEAEARALLDGSRAVSLGDDLAWELDMRYRGQAYNLTVPLGPRPATAEAVAAAERAFVAEHHHLYDYTPAVPETEIVTIRLRASARTAPAHAAADPQAPSETTRQRVYDGAWADWPVVPRGALSTAAPLAGPAIIEQDDTTTVLHRGWTATALPDGALVLERA